MFDERLALSQIRDIASRALRAPVRPPEPGPSPEPDSAPDGSGTPHRKPDVLLVEPGIHEWALADDVAEWRVYTNSNRHAVRVEDEWLAPGEMLPVQVKGGDYPHLPSIGHPDWAPQQLRNAAQQVLPRIWFPHWSRGVDDSHGGTVVAPHFHWRLCDPAGVFLAREEMVRVARHSRICMFEDDGTPVLRLPHKTSWALPMGPHDDPVTPLTGLPPEEHERVQTYGSVFELTHFIRQWRGAHMMHSVGCALGTWLLGQYWNHCRRWLEQPDHGQQGAWRDWDHTVDPILNGPAGVGNEIAGRGLYHLFAIAVAARDAGVETDWWLGEFADLCAHIARPENGTSGLGVPATPHFFKGVLLTGHDWDCRVWGEDLQQVFYPTLGLDGEHARFLRWRREEGLTPVAVSGNLHAERITDSDVVRSTIAPYADAYDQLWPSLYGSKQPPGSGGQMAVYAEGPDVLPVNGLLT